jgi:hypothetical protein
MQRKDNFENTVSRLLREFSLNSEFIMHSPNCPALRGKVGPNKSLGSGLKPSRMKNHSSLELGFQSTLNMSRTPLQRNWAKEHWKKMCSTCSMLPQSAHFPLEGPNLARI